jgi:hypothetical protein
MLEEEEYIDCTFTVGIAIAIARKDKRSLDDVVRNCSLALVNRIKHQRVKNLYMGIALDENPAVAFTLISNQVFSPGLVVPVVAPRALWLETPDKVFSHGGIKTTMSLSKGYGA